MAAITLSAFLLFQIQPILARQLLPLYGGTPALLSSCLLTFQTLLLVGYLYGWVLSRQSLQAQRAIHAFALVAAVGTLSTDPQNIPSEYASHELTVAFQIMGTVGLAYLLLSATSTLVQGWYVAASNDRAPERLFALSNLASLGGVICLPVSGGAKPLDPRAGSALGIWIRRCSATSHHRCLHGASERSLGEPGGNSVFSAGKNRAPLAISLSTRIYPSVCHHEPTLPGVGPGSLSVGCPARHLPPFIRAYLRE